MLSTGHKIGAATLLFEKIGDATIAKQLERLEKTKQANQQEAQAAAEATVAPQEGFTSYDDFAKMDIRIDIILSAEKMPKADKLLILKVDTGIDQRAIISGIAQSFNPEEIIGKRVTVLMNLVSRKLRGVESQGIILMVENVEGKYRFIAPDDEEVANGAGVK